MDNEIIEHGENLPATATEKSPMELMEQAISLNADPAVLEKLMGLQERYEDRASEKAFNQSFMEFTSNPPKIIKDMAADFNGSVQYHFADLGKINDTIKSELLKYDLAHRWETEDLERGASRITCVLMHKDGHSVKSSLSSGIETSGSKNNVQGVGSTVTYLERYTLLSILGLVAVGIDNDGRAPEPPAPEKIDAGNVQIIEGLIEEHEIDKKRFLSHYGVSSISEITVDMLPKVNQGISDKAKQNKESQDENS